MNTTTNPKPTIAARIAEIKTRFGLTRTQCFIEGKTLTLQALPKDTAGTFGCEWKPQRGESMHDAIDEAIDYLETRTAIAYLESGKAIEVTQTDRLYYYRPCAFDNGATLKCAGFGAEDPAHRAFYVPHFDKCEDERHLLPGTLVLRGYHGDKIPKGYAQQNAI